MQHSASVRRGRAKDIPFGIRALERGVEVEGIWNSGANTPVPSVPGSPILSVTTMKGKRPCDASTERPSTATSAVSSITPDGTYDVADHRSASFPPETQNCGRSYYTPRHQPRRSSGLRFSNFNDDASHAETLETVQGRSLAEASRSGQCSISGSSSSTSEDEHHKRPDNSYANRYLHPEAGSNHSAYHDYPSSANSSQTSQEGNPFLTPTVSRQSTEGTCPLSHSNGLVPLDGASEPAIYHTQLLTDAEITYDDGHAQPLRPFNVNLPERKSQVVRKVNSGFEILKPGTLTTARQSTDVGSQWREETSKEKRSPRKLRKNDRRQASEGKP